MSNQKMQKLSKTKSMMNALDALDTLRGLKNKAVQKVENKRMYDRWTDEYDEYEKSDSHADEKEYIKYKLDSLDDNRKQKLANQFNPNIGARQKLNNIRIILENSKKKEAALKDFYDYDGVRDVTDLKHFSDLFGSRKKRRSHKRKLSKKRKMSKRKMSKR